MIVTIDIIFFSLTLYPENRRIGEVEGTGGTVGN